MVDFNWFDFDDFDLRQNRDSGQLWLLDRKLLWNTVRELKPKLAVETGTWKGGGSTFFIASAMAKNGFGKLYSVEGNPEMFNEAVKSYHGPTAKWPHLRDHVDFNFGDSVQVYSGFVDALKRNGKQLDFVFLDGGEDVTSAEFDLLAPMVRVGGVLASHDWFNGKRIDKLVDEAAAGIWDLRIFGYGKGSFESGSVGFAKATRLK